MLSAHAHNKYYELVKVINNASGTCLAASYPQTGMQSPIESECKIPIPRSGAERESVVFWLISPGAYIQPRAYGVYRPLIQSNSINIFTHTRKSRSIDCAMCAQGMCSTEL